jgi:hypothetical protein
MLQSTDFPRPLHFGSTLLSILNRGRTSADRPAKSTPGIGVPIESLAISPDQKLQLPRNGTPCSWQILKRGDPLDITRTSSKKAELARLKGRQVNRCRSTTPGCKASGWHLPMPRSQARWPKRPQVTLETRRNQPARSTEGDLQCCAQANLANLRPSASGSVEHLNQGREDKAGSGYREMTAAPFGSTSFRRVRSEPALAHATPKQIPHSAGHTLAMPKCHCAPAIEAVRTYEPGIERQVATSRKANQRRQLLQRD